MKIKSINDFTLAECQEYLDTNPNGEFAQEVVQRMEYLQQIIVRRSQQNNARWINEFNTEFNRHFATQRYEEAFAICLKYLSKVDRKAEIVEKANSVIPKLKNRIQLPSSVAISYDWLIDQLVLNGYDKMKYDGKSLDFNYLSIRLTSDGSQQVVKISPNLAIRLLYSCILGCCPIGILCLFIFSVLFFLYGEEGVDFPLWLLGVGWPVIILLVRLVIKIGTSYNKTIHIVAQIIVEYLSKQ